MSQVVKEALARKNISHRELAEHYNKMFPPGSRGYKKPRKTKSGESQGGITQAVITNSFLARTGLSDYIIDAARDILQLPKEWPWASPEVRKVSLAGTPLAPIRAVGKVAAGDGEHNVDSQEDLYYVPESVARTGAVGYVIDGDSMAPNLEKGDICMFKEDPTPRRGYAFLLRDEDKGLRVKRLGWRDGWTMESTNPAYPTEQLGSTQIIGILTGWYRVKGLRETLDFDPDGLRLE